MFPLEGGGWECRSCWRAFSVTFIGPPSATGSGILVSKSTDGGDTWSEPTTLVRNIGDADVPPYYFNDKESITADPSDSNYVYGEYYGVSPYRITDGGAAFFSNKAITHGINTKDRSEFYLPFVLNHDDVNQLFTGTYRMYRTDNAKAPAAGDVTWKPISGDLTSGCPGPAPNGGRGCVISAIGIGGGDAAYAGTEEGYVWVSPDAQTADSPS